MMPQRIAQPGGGPKYPGVGSHLRGLNHTGRGVAGFRPNRINDGIIGVGGRRRRSAPIRRQSSSARVRGQHRGQKYGEGIALKSMERARAKPWQPAPSPLEIIALLPYKLLIIKLYSIRQFPREKWDEQAA